MVRKQNGWMRRLLDRCSKAYEALKQDRWGLLYTVKLYLYRT